jgi:hypothetical protein
MTNRPSMAQTAPYPEVLADIVRVCSYRPDWKLWLSHDDYDRGQGCVGLTLVITVVGPNSYPPHETITVRHLFGVPAAAYNRQSWLNWLFDCFVLVERHECMEWFVVDGDKPYAPCHGPGWDPYLVTHERTDTDRRTSFRGEVDA